jgi:hypothetical protein
VDKMLRMGQVKRDPAIAQDACERGKNATPQKPDRPPVVTCVSSDRVRFARPKSKSFASKLAPSRMLLGLTSRWMHRGWHSWGKNPHDDVSTCASSFQQDVARLDVTVDAPRLALLGRGSAR